MIIGLDFIWKCPALKGCLNFFFAIIMLGGVCQEKLLQKIFLQQILATFVTIFDLEDHKITKSDGLRNSNRTIHAHLC